MAGALLAAGCAEAGDLEEADLIVINSCSIRETAEQKVIGRMGVAGAAARPPTRRSAWSSRAARCGPTTRPACGVATRPWTSSCDPTRSPSWSHAWASPARPPRARSAGPGFQRVGRSVAATADRLPATRAPPWRQGRIAASASARAWLPIIYGCDKTCTYCIVPFSRGPERSRPFDDIVAEARTLAAAGCREVTLLGQNVNSWGHDLPPDPRFADVSGERRLGRAPGSRRAPGHRGPAARHRRHPRRPDGRPAIPRLRFVTSHPWDLTDRLIAAMADCPSVCEHLHLPVQSGSDEVLRRMGRQYGVAAYGDLVARCGPPCPASASRRTSSWASAARPRRSSRRRSSCCAGRASTRSSRRPTRRGRARRRTRSPTTCPAAEKRRRLNALLALQEGIGLRAQPGLAGPPDGGPRRGGPPASPTMTTITTSADADAGDGPRAPRSVARASWAATASTSSSTSTARPSWSVSSWTWSSSAPAPTRWPAGGRGRAASRLSCRPSSSSPAPPRPARPPWRSSWRDACPAPRSSRPTRARSTAAWTSARPRRRQPSAPRVPHHGLDLVDPDEPFTAADYRRAALAGAGGHRRPGRAGHPGRRHGPLPAGRRARPAPGRPARGRRGARRARGAAWRGMASTALVAELRDARSRRRGRAHRPAQPAPRRPRPRARRS